MNIYMAGASGTGKTSLAQELSDRLGMLEAPSVSRTSPYKMGTQTNQDYILFGVLYQCRSSTQSIITRTPIDVLAYSKLWGLEVESPIGVSALWMRDQPIILYLPKYWATPADGFRPTEGQDEVDATIENTLTAFGVLGDGLEMNHNPRVYVVKDESIADRADNVIEWLNSNKLLD